MVHDSLYDRIPKPDIVLGQHVTPMKTGYIAARSGPSMAAADSFNVTIFGRGGHGSQPQSTIDPIAIAGYVIVRLQSIVSRELQPGEFAVVTCGSIHAGETENIIPDRCELKLNIRTFDAAVREHVLAAVVRIIESECEASGCEKRPEIKATTSFPLTDNDTDVTTAIFSAFRAYFGDEKVVEGPKWTASEDFGILGSAIGVPYSFWHFGGTDEKKWDEAEKAGKTQSMIPGNHSPFFAPVIQPTLRIGVDAMAVAALTFLA